VADPIRVEPTWVGIVFLERDKLHASSMESLVSLPNETLGFLSSAVVSLTGK
jgi:hypothetical protein